MIGANIVINRLRIHKLKFYNNKNSIQRHNISGHKVFIIGNIFEDKFKLKNKLKEIIIKNKYKELLNINGEYFIFIQKKNKEIIIGNSKNSYIPIFYSYKNNILNIRSNIIDFEKKFFKKINFNKIYSWLLLNGRSFDNKTFLKEVKVLSSGDLCIIKSKKFLSYRSDIFNYVNKNLSLNKNISQVSNALKISINKRIESVKGNISFGLSGGLDSRILLSLIDKKYKKRIFTHTYGDKNNFESIIAKKVAHNLGFKHRFYEIKKKDYYDQANNSVKYGSFQTVFKNGVKTKYTKKIVKNDNSKFLIIGNALDVLISSSFSPEGLKKIKKIESYISWYKKNFQLFNSYEIKSLFKNFSMNTKKLIDDPIKFFYKKIKHKKNYINFNDALTFESRIKKWHNPSLAQQSRITNFLIPTYDLNFLDACSNISSKYRYNDYFRKKLIHKINSRISKIPTTDEMIKKFKSLKFKNKYYDTNLGLDMKNGKEFFTFYNNIKVKFKLTIFKKKFNLKYLNFLIEQHRSGVKDNTRKIFMCITLLIILINISKKSV